MKVSHFYDDVFLGDFYIVSDCTFEQFITHAEKELVPEMYKFIAENSKDKDLSNSLTGFTFFNIGYGCVIYLKRLSKHDTKAHECLHAAFEMLEHKGIPTGYDNQEVIAYYQAHLIRSIDKYSKSQKKGKNK
jgi:hypothetical protein